jgi:hypothetical protein
MRDVARIPVDLLIDSTGGLTMKGADLLDPPMMMDLRPANGA